MTEQLPEQKLAECIGNHNYVVDMIEAALAPEPEQPPSEPHEHLNGITGQWEGPCNCEGDSSFHSPRRPFSPAVHTTEQPASAPEPLGTCDEPFHSRSNAGILRHHAKGDACINWRPL